MICSKYFNFIYGTRYNYSNRIFLSGTVLWLETIRQYKWLREWLWNYDIRQRTFTEFVTKLEQTPSCGKLAVKGLKSTKSATVCPLTKRILCNLVSRREPLWCPFHSDCLLSCPLSVINELTVQFIFISSSPPPRIAITIKSIQIIRIV